MSANSLGPDVRRRFAFVGTIAAVSLAHAIALFMFSQGRVDRSSKSPAHVTRIQLVELRAMAPMAPVAFAPAVMLKPVRTLPMPRRMRVDAQPAEPAQVAQAAASAASQPATEHPDPAAFAAAQVAAQAALAALSPASSAASGPPAFVWPASTRVSYRLEGNYRGDISGRARVDWVHAPGDRYQVHLDVVVGLPFAPLLERHLSSEGRLTREGLAPERFEQTSKLAMHPRYTASLRSEGDRVVFSNGVRAVRPANLQDSTSQFIQLSYLFATQADRLRPGATIELPLALPRRIDRVVYEVGGLEPVYTPIGAIDAIHLAPRGFDSRSGDLAVDMWLAPTLRYLPVRIKIRQDADTWLDLVIERAPQLAAPVGERPPP